MSSYNNADSIIPLNGNPLAGWNVHVVWHGEWTIEREGDGNNLPPQVQDRNLRRDRCCEEDRETRGRRRRRP